MTQKAPWWSRRWGRDNVCGINLVRIRPGSNKNGTKYTTTLECGHSFSTFSLFEWIKSTPDTENRVCPICRRQFDVANLTRS